ncbi:hypothetical protein PsYK624_162410 [Phanerochaete sordida]|uniref:Uncharacterized protein n=1 Tax=Phanerochaete sordida TaxID=48140 RepID=A0A9P3GQL5_9APHY|nr:hypothetical protein PsYK624_162410 [Phanerochaete sordida]
MAGRAPLTSSYSCPYLSAGRPALLYSDTHLHLETDLNRAGLPESKHLALHAFKPNYSITRPIDVVAREKGRVSEDDNIPMRPWSMAGSFCAEQMAD